MTVSNTYLINNGTILYNDMDQPKLLKKLYFRFNFLIELIVH